MAWLGTVKTKCKESCMTDIYPPTHLYCEKHGYEIVVSMMVNKTLIKAIIDKDKLTPLPTPTKDIK